MRSWIHSVRLGLTLLDRDWRSGELHLLVLSLVLAVGAMTSVGFFADRLRSGLERDAAQLLGADLVLSADEPIDPGVRNEARRRGLAVVDTVSFPSMALAGDTARLTSVEAVSAGYPLRGSLRVAVAPGNPDGPTSKVPETGQVWVEQALLSDLKLHMGDELRLGDKRFRITRIVTLEPDRGLSFINIAPRVLMSLSDLEATGLIQTGSRETRRLLVAGPAPSVEAFRNWLVPRLARGQRIESLEGGRPEVRATLDRAEQFLSLVALLAAILAAVAVALAARRFSERHRDACAVMLCLGATQSELLRLFICEFLAIGVIGSLIGCGLGLVAHYGFIVLLGSLIEGALPAPHLEPAFQGILVGFVLLVGFALPPVIQLREVPPVRVLRHETGMPRGFTVLGYCFGVCLFVLLLLWTAHDLKIGLLTAGGFAAAFGLFSAVAWLVLRALGRARHLPRISASVRFALASMQRRPLASMVQTVALALGLMALLLLSVTRTDLISAWRKSIPADAPNRFVINIEPDQRDAFRAFLDRAGVGTHDLAPMVRGRLVAVNGRAIGPNDYKDTRAKRLVDREFNLSYADTVPLHNRIVQGQWFTQSTGQVSMEEGIATTLGLKLGDQLSFDIAGQKVAGRITSLRKLEWDSMHVNFFVIFPRPALSDMPKTWIAAFHLSDSQTNLSNQLTQDFPNITVVDMTAVLRQIQSIVDQVVRAVEFLFLFTLSAGLLVLYAALMSSRDERTREAGLLRALGASGKQLSRSQFFEFIVLGALSGILAAAGAVAVGWVLSIEVFDFPYMFRSTPWVAGILGGILIATFGGWLGLRPVLNQPPMATLREV